MQRPIFFVININNRFVHFQEVYSLQTVNGGNFFSNQFIVKRNVASLTEPFFATKKSCQTQTLFFFDKHFF